MTYTGEELDLLRLYTCREQKGNIQYREKIDEVLEINEFSNSVVNTFLGKAGKTLPPYGVQKGSDLRDFLRQIEVLYGLACRYGASHELPKKLYREGNLYNATDEVSKEKEEVWITNSFTSCSTSRGETDSFKANGSQKFCILPSEQDLKSKKIPFIEVNDVLNESHVYNGEKEIILPPFLMMFIENQENTTLQEQLDVNPEKNDYIMHVTGKMVNPYINNRIRPFDCEIDDMTDEEFNLLVSSLQKNGEKTSEEEQYLSYLLCKMQNYLITRCRTINSLYMENPIIIDGRISQSNFEMLQYFMDNNISEINKNEKMPDFNKKGAVYSFEDILGYIENSNSFKDLIVVPDEQLVVTPELVASILNKHNNKNIERLIEQSDRQKMKKLEQDENVSMQDIVKNAINKGVTAEQVEKIDRMENLKANEKNIEGVEKGE